MKSNAVKLMSLGMLASALPWAAGAGTLTENFTVTHNYVTSGVTGTVWDGVYLGFGDVPGSNNGGDGAGTTLQAGAAEIVPGFGVLTVQTMNSTWAGAGNDGFFLYKNVKGDFDVSVAMPAPYDNSAYHFSGLMVRAAVSPTGAAFNGAENWLTINRFSEFGLSDGVRFATNGADNEFLYTPGNDADAATADRFFRITRVGDTFSFYDKTNQGDAWALEATITRGDLSGVPMQVGLKQAVFTGNSPTVTFASFVLSGSNVLAGTPPSPATGLTVVPASSNSLTLSWTAGAGSAGSVVLVREGGPLTHQPSDGVTYTGNTNLGAGDHLGGGNYVVSAGTNTSVTVSGLGGSNITYYVAVYAYSGSGSSITYSQTTPPVTNAPGPGVLQSISLVVPGNEVLLGGVAIPTVFASYNSGTSNDVTSLANLVSDTPGVITVTSGTLSAISAGSATLTASYSGFNTNHLLTVKTTPSFTDNFGVSHNYKVDGLPGSPWDGGYFGFGDIPGGDNGGDTGVTASADANTTSNSTLSVQSSGTTWVGTADDGFFLFKNAPGDFQVSVHLGPFDLVNYNFVGLMARASGPGGAPYNGAENWVYWSRFDEFGVTTDARTAIDGADNEFPLFNGITNRWLLMVRQNGSNFMFFDKQNPGDPWTPRPSVTIVRPDLVGVPMQVGLFQATYQPNPVEQAQFDSFVLDGTGVNVGTPPATASNLNMTLGLNNSVDLNWTPGPGSSGSVVVMRAGKPVSAQPLSGVTYAGNAAFGSGEDLGAGNYVVYSGSGTNVNVSNLTGGITYFAAVYSYSGSGASRTYNIQTSGTNKLLVGILVSISPTLPASIPVNGVGLPLPKVIGNYLGGSINDVTAGATFTSSDSNVIAIVDNVLSGISNGSAVVTVSYGGFTNTVVVGVRNPIFKDNFAVAHDYAVNRVTNSGWDGIYLNAGDIPGGFAFNGDSGPGVTSLADANITSNGVLTVRSSATDWEGPGEDGFFLFKNVTGDFQTSVHLGPFDVDTNNANFNTPGLLARAYTGAGAPLGGLNGETWVSWTRFDDFGISTYARFTINNATTQRPNGDTNPDRWLLLARVNGTNFLFFQRVNATDPWRPGATTMNLAAFAGLPLQVGLQQATFGNTLVQQAEFDHFMLDTGVPPLTIRKSGGNVILSWPVAYAGFGVEATPGLNPVNWLPAGGAPVTNGGNLEVSVGITNNTTYFRLKK